MEQSRAFSSQNNPASLWRNTLAQIPTTFGRLVYLAGMRDENTGVYSHHGLASMYGDEEASRTLRESHVRTFLDWLGRPLAEQREDLDEYLASLEETQKIVVATWVKLHPYARLIPAEVQGAERELFLADMEALIELLRNEFGVAGPDPDSSPLP
ncbi:MAG: hypothetical protein K2X35_22900 [Bryobacteraceae bacterium]|nr:hypothetical protein [Bryobacteraceae bacterium]